MAVNETKEQKRERQLAELAGSDLATIEGRPPGAPAPEAPEEEHTENVEEPAEAPARTGPETPPAQRGDPGVDFSDVQEKRLRAIVNDQTDEVLAELTDLRDRADQLMHTIRDANAEIVEIVTTNARRIAKAIKAKNFMASALAQIEAEFANGGKNAVITQQKK
jgi:hypothetical protein